MPEQGQTHGQRMQQKERALWQQVQAQLAQRTTPSATSPDTEAEATPSAELVGTVTVTSDEQEAIRAFLRGLS